MDGQNTLIGVHSAMQLCVSCVLSNSGVMYSLASLTYINLLSCMHTMFQNQKLIGLHIII